MTAETDRSPWYRSFYWRIGVSFLALVVAVIVGQSVIFSFVMRSASTPPVPPHLRAANIAAGIGRQLEANPQADVGAALSERYGRDRQRIYYVAADGAVSGNTPQPLAGDMKQAAMTMLGASTPAVDGRPSSGGPMVAAPVQVGGTLRGMVVLPPPPMPGLSREVGRLLSLPGTLVLFAATLLVTLIIFRPARRRLLSLEDSAARLGGGDLSARAPDAGGDEIARVARAFNRMASDLAARDEALRQSDRSRRQMLADISHELRTPLTTMRGYLETLRMPAVVSDGATRERYLETVEHETRRLERIVLDLLDLAKLEGGGRAFEVRVFDVERLFAAVVRRHERAMQARGITARTRVGETADQGLGDPNRVEQVIDNLFANAISHSPDHGEIVLQSEAASDGVRLSVIDGGDGIPPEHLPHVFDRFYKADSGRSATEGGSGLGLSIARAIVERHGGAIAVSSVPGRTEFIVTLPTQSASANL